ETQTDLWRDGVEAVAGPEQIENALPLAGKRREVAMGRKPEGSAHRARIERAAHVPLGIGPRADAPQIDAKIAEAYLITPRRRRLGIAHRQIEPVGSDA